MVEQKEISDYNTFAKEISDNRLHVDDVLGQSIVVQKVDLEDSTIYEGKKMLVLTVVLPDGQQVEVSTFSAVLIKQANNARDHLPFRTTIKRQKSYYVFS